MTTRERNLAMILIAVVAVLVAGAVANAVILQPLNSLGDKIERAEREKYQADSDINAEKARIKRIEELNPNLANWQKLSLPEGDPKAAAFQTHLGRVKRLYGDYLNKAVIDSGFKVRSMKLGEFDARTAPTTPDKKPIGYVLATHIEGDTSLESVVKLFEELYRAPILHQVKTFSIATTKTSNDLTVKMTLEALLVNGAEHVSKRDGIFAKFTNKGTDKEPVLLARSTGRYQDITNKNIFFPPRDPVPGADNPGQKEQDLINELKYVHLTMIWRSDYHGGCYVARIHNKGNKDDTALLIDAPLPKTSPFLRAKKDLEDKRRTGQTSRRDPRGAAAKVEDKLEEPVQKWEIKDHPKAGQPQTTLLELQVVRIEPFRLIFQANEKFYSVHAGESLLSAMRKEDDEGELSDNALDKAQLKKLGLMGDPAEVLKKVKLSSLKFSKDRNAFESLFLNPENKDEKRVLSADTLPEEFVPPAEWIVKDHFATEILKLKVVRVEKERVIVEVDKKHYAVKPGGNLHDAMAKPLTANEIKALGLKGS
ncbi:MAG: hypothetical protein HYS12_24545 [Planctomycetes bacterium]|nr:hypothetical protein [Planctomycetota bacterium]